MTSTGRDRASWSRGTSSRWRSPGRGPTYIGSSAVVGGALSTIFVIGTLPSQLRPSPAKVMFTPSGLLFLSGIIDLGVSLVIIVASVALAGTALLARRLARRGGRRLRAGAASLGSALAGGALSFVLPPDMLLDHQSSRTHTPAIVACMIAGGLLGSAYEAFFQFRKRRATTRPRTRDKP